MPRNPRFQPIAGLACAILVCLLMSGCVHRRLTIRSNPPGARAFVDGEEVGFTPVSIDFTYYGTREVTLVLDGYETKTAYPELRKPWYQYLPFEFFTDNLSPVKINNRHEYMFHLQPLRVVPNDEILNNGWELRNAAQIPE